MMNIINVDFIMKLLTLIYCLWQHHQIYICHCHHPKCYHFFQLASFWPSVDKTLSNSPQRCEISLQCNSSNKHVLNVLICYDLYVFGNSPKTWQQCYSYSIARPNIVCAYRLQAMLIMVWGAITTYLQPSTTTSHAIYAYIDLMHIFGHMTNLTLFDNAVLSREAWLFYTK